MTFLDSCGIGEFVGAQPRAHRDGGERTPIDQVLHTSALDGTVETISDPAKAARTGAHE